MWFTQIVLGIVLCFLGVTAMIFMTFMLDELVLNGYFSTKLRKRFNVEDLK